MKKSKTPVTFVDLGAYDGDSVERYLRLGGQIDHAHLFEPNPNVVPRRLACLYSWYPVGAWIKSGCMTLREGAEHPALGASFYETGASLGEVPVIDFPKWLDQLQAGGPIVLKMNIEGAEFELLPALGSRGALRRVSRIYLSLHRKGPGRTVGANADIERFLEMSGFAQRDLNTSVYSPKFFSQWERKS